MRFTRTIFCLATAASLVCGALAQQKMLSIMPLGGSTTELGCWRAYLWSQLASAGITNIKYVGSMIDDKACGWASYDRHHEGHSGHQAIDIANRLDYLTSWLKPFMPDIVIIHLGTVDIVFGKAQADILVDFDTIVDMFRAKNPNVAFVIIAKIIPIPSSTAKVTALNSALPAWATKKMTATSPITWVDQNTGFTVSTDLKSDGLHPTDAGDKKMTTVWYPAVLKTIQTLQIATAI